VAGAWGVKRPGSTAGLRGLLIADDNARRERWRQPSPGWEWLTEKQRELPMTDWDIDLRAGRSVVVSATQMLSALLHAGLPHRQFAYGGADWDKCFILDEDDRLTEAS
jgi:hypothetical protein